MTEAELAGMAKLGDRTPDNKKGVPEARVNDLCEKVAALGIVRDEHGIRGPGVDGGPTTARESVSSGART